MEQELQWLLSQALLPMRMRGFFPTCWYSCISFAKKRFINGSENCVSDQHSNAHARKEYERLLRPCDRILDLFLLLYCYSNAWMWLMETTFRKLNSANFFFSVHVHFDQEFFNHSTSLPNYSYQTYLNKRIF